MNDQTKGAGRVSNLTDEARARGAASTRTHACFKMEAVMSFLAVARLHSNGNWRGRSLRAKAELLEGNCTPDGNGNWRAAQVARLEAKARGLIEVLEAGELQPEHVFALIETPRKGFAPPECIAQLFESFEYLREAVEKESE